MSYVIVQRVFLEGKQDHLFLIDNSTDKPMEFETPEQAETVRKDFGPGYEVKEYKGTVA